MTRYSLAFDQGTLVLSGPVAEEVKRLFPRGTWKWDGRIKAWRGEAMHYRDVMTYALKDEVPAPPSVRFPKADLPPLDASQKAALKAWEAQGGCGTVVLPSAGLVLRAVRYSGTATLIAAPGRNGMYRWHRTVGEMLGYEAGLVGDSHFDVRAVTVATYDGAGIHMARMGACFGLLVFDEAEQLLRGFRSDVARFSMATKRLGLTSTVVQSVELERELNRLIGPPAGWAHQPQSRQVKKIRLPRSEMKMERILSAHASERVLILTGSDKASIELSQRFLVPALLGTTGSGERAAVLRGFACRLFPVIVAGWTHVMGMEMPMADVAILLASSREAGPVVDGGTVYLPC